MGKILIIDDDKDIAELVSLILRKEKIESDIITDSLEALKVLETGNYNYDLTFCSKKSLTSKVGMNCVYLCLKNTKIHDITKSVDKEG